MAANANKPLRALTSDARIEAAIGLLTALTNSPDHRVSATVVCRDLALKPNQLEEVVSLLQLLADRRTGSRAVIYREADDIVLDGTAGTLGPLRLTDEEALAISLVLERYQLDGAVTKRLERALMPRGRAETTASLPLAGDALFGGYYQQLIEAKQDGVRCRIAYRADHDKQAAERTVDLGFIEVAGDAAYLIAWDIKKDAQRRYRLDRIASVTYTEDSVVEHPFRRMSPAESLREAGSTASVRFSNRVHAEALDWAGLDANAGTENPDGSFTAPVSYATETWLFDHVLAAAGSIRIEGPLSLRARFLAYAKSLL